MDTKELCLTLASIEGTPGDESKVCEKVKELTSSLLNMEENKLGSLVGIINENENGIKILLDAHIDQIGLIVRKIDDKGFLLIDKVGGVDERILIGSEVVVHGTQELFGVVCSTPPHLLSDDKKDLSIKTMAVDIGYSKIQAEKLVEIGDRITLRSKSAQLLGDLIVSPAFDDRSGIVAIIKALEMLDGKIKNCQICVQFSSQEEVGGSGAKTSSFAFMPDVAIAVDVGFGYGPNCNADETIALEKGPSIGLSPVLDRALGKELTAICKENDIPVQYDIMAGRTGTNADQISITGCGVKTALLSIPLRNMHTTVEAISTKDVENTAKLIAAYILKKDGEQDA